MTLRIIELCTDRLPCLLQKGGAVETYVYGISRAMERLGAEVHLVSIEKQKYVDYGNIHVHTINLTAPIVAKLRNLLIIIARVSY